MCKEGKRKEGYLRNDEQVACRVFVEMYKRKVNITRAVTRSFTGEMHIK